MAVIAQTTGVIGASGPVTLAETTMTASDTLAYQNGGAQRILFVNPTASPIVVTLTGSTGTPSIPVLGVGTVAATGGKAVTVAANSVSHLNLDIYAFWLAGNGTVTLTNGTGLLAALYV